MKLMPYTLKVFSFMRNTNAKLVLMEFVLIKCFTFGKP